ncbi:MAG: DUF6671 family protein [Pseudanabaenaceae cyanobacterium bins.39]|nr:DUF6671 family protein [Pseudanabaenaceae cyanobacterium bins.39]
MQTQKNIIETHQIEFRDRLAIIATMHHKEKAIAPILEANLGLNSLVPKDFDSDLFGTFTRDIDRPAGQIETAKLKAMRGLELWESAEIAIASEGSFFPHPLLGLPYNREIVLLHDKRHNFTVYGEHLSAETNFRHRQISSYDQAYEFAVQIGFPDHAIVLMPDAQTTAKQSIYKGINSIEMLRSAVDELLARSPNHQIHIETDMRALHNPTRMQNITKATSDLVRKLQQRCPQCNFVNFDVTDKIGGLPCELCGLPTPSIRAHRYSCERCQFQQEIPFPNHTQTADPMYCNYCNP